MTDMNIADIECNARYQAYLRAAGAASFGRSLSDYMEFIAALKSAFPGTDRTDIRIRTGTITDQAAFSEFINAAVEDDQVQRVGGRWVVMT